MQFFGWILTRTQADLVVPLQVRYNAVRRQTAAKAGEKELQAYSFAAIQAAASR